MASFTLSKQTAEPELFFQSLNPAGSETLLLIHGGFGSNKEWENVVPPLVENGYHVLLPDLPAHGQFVGIQPFTVDYAAGLILRLIAKHARNRSAHIVGPSIGAHVAACVAERGGPNQVLSVIASGYNFFQPHRFTVLLLAPPIFFLHHVTNAATDIRAEVAAWQNGEASYALIKEVTRTILQPKEIGDIHVRLLAVASTSNDTWLSRDRTSSSNRLLEAVVNRRENGSRAVMHRGIRHNWHLEEPALFGAMILAWITSKPLDNDFEDI
jgi:pimeloyl-ACP methyl ester carboxylesterase